MLREFLPLVIQGERVSQKVQGLVVSADSWDRPVKCEPWVMDDGKAPGLTGNNSLPRGLGPFTGHKEAGIERDGLASPPFLYTSPLSKLKTWGFHWLPSNHGKQTTINMKYELPVQ